MLVLACKPDERIRVGNNIVVTVVRFHNGAVRLGFDAPRDLQIDRESVWQSKQAEAEASPAIPGAPSSAAELWNTLGDAEPLDLWSIPDNVGL